MSQNWVTAAHPDLEETIVVSERSLSAMREKGWYQVDDQPTDTEIGQQETEEEQ